jgi:hypothetical protein
MRHEACEPPAGANDAITSASDAPTAVCDSVTKKPGKSPCPTARSDD